MLVFWELCIFGVSFLSKDRELIDWHLIVLDQFHAVAFEGEFEILIDFRGVARFFSKRSSKNYVTLKMTFLTSPRNKYCKKTGKI